MSILTTLVTFALSYPDTFSTTEDVCTVIAALQYIQNVRVSHVYI